MTNDLCGGVAVTSLSQGTAVSQPSLGQNKTVTGEIAFRSLATEAQKVRSRTTNIKL